MYRGKIKIISYITVICFYLALRLYSFPSIRDNSSRQWILVVLFFAGIAAGLIANHYVSAERKQEQEERDRLAQKLVEKVESAILSGVKVPRFSLYLRPFSVERRTQKPQGQARLWQIFFPHVLLTNLFFYRNVNFDFELQTYLDPLGLTLISIGYPNNTEGAGHVITTEVSWQDRFRQLAEHAAIIIVVPGVQTGILSEIRWLRASGLLVKAIFFKPANYPRDDWQKMKEFYDSAEGIEFPNYSSKQLSFRLYSSGRCYEVLRWRAVYGKRKVKRGEAQMRSLLAGKRE